MTAIEVSAQAMSTYNRWRWCLRITLQSPIHIGSGGGHGLAIDEALVRNHDGDPFVPSTTLRGALRSLLDAQLPIIVEGAAARSCLLDGREKECPGAPGSPAFEMHAAQRASRLNQRSSATANDTRFCHVCDLFGNVWQASRVSVSDGVFLNSKLLTQFRESIGVDRATGIAKEYSHTVVEVIPAGEQFECTVEGRNLTTVNVTLLTVLFAQSRNGSLRVGGKGRLGLGSCSTELVDVRRYDPDLVSAEERRKFLLDGDLPQLDPHDFLSKSLAQFGDGSR